MDRTLLTRLALNESLRTSLNDHNCFPHAEPNLFPFIIITWIRAELFIDFFVYVRDVTRCIGNFFNYWMSLKGYIMSRRRSRAGRMILIDRPTLKRTNFVQWTLNRFIGRLDPHLREDKFSNLLNSLRPRGLDQNQGCHPKDFLPTGHKSSLLYAIWVEEPSLWISREKNFRRKFIPFVHWPPRQLFSKLLVDCCHLIWWLVRNYGESMRPLGRMGGGRTYRRVNEMKNPSTPFNLFKTTRLFLLNREL